MRILLENIIFIVFLSTIHSEYGYTDLTPAEVHNRLVQGDTLLVLDVREISEYRAGHMAEPEGQLPLTPVNMPWSSDVLSTEYDHLPNDIDIIVYCKSGGRSASASSFLESKGFARIYNMTGGFNSWIYEYRQNGFGDHSGKWIHMSDSKSITITGDLCKIIFPSNVLPLTDSIYIEVHNALSQILVPPNIPQLDIDGLFRITVLDQFGLPMFDSDSLILLDTVIISLFPHFEGEEINHSNMTVYVPGEGWRNVTSLFESRSFQRKEMILRRWYNIEGYISTGIITHTVLNNYILYQNYPNPFNPVTVISWQVAPKGVPSGTVSSHVELSIYNILGQKVTTLVNKKQPAGAYNVEWNASDFASGVYLYRLETDQGFTQTKKLVLLR